MPQNPPADNNQSKFRVTINPKKLAWKLEAISFILALVSLSVQYLKYTVSTDNLAGLIPLVDMDTELSIPSIYAFILLFIAAALLILIAAHKKQAQARYAAQWYVLAAGFTFMAFDEGASIHELLMAPMGKLLGGSQPGIFYFTWIVPALAGITLLGLFFVRFMVDLPAKTRRAFLLGAALYLGGAVGFEMLGGELASAAGMKNFGFSILATIEELLELSGTIVFLSALLAYIREQFQTVLININR
jgi:hypothetical protein